MADYADRAALVSRFGDAEISSLEDPDHTGSPDDGISAAALKDSTEEINSYVGVLYKFPLPNVPEPLVRACCDIARFRMYKDRPTEQVTYRYEKTIEWLKNLAKGTAVLVFDPALTDAEIEEKVITVAVGTTYEGGVFSNETLNKMPTF